MIFAASVLLALLSFWLGRRSNAPADDEEERRAESERRMRAMEAETRVGRRREEDALETLQRQAKELSGARAMTDSLQKQVEQRDELLRKLTEELRQECSKTVDLRRELSERAEDTIRTQARIREMETEISLAEAGSEQIIGELRSLQEEHRELTSRLRALGEDEVPDSMRGND